MTLKLFLIASTCRLLLLLLLLPAGGGDLLCSGSCLHQTGGADHAATPGVRLQPSRVLHTYTRSHQRLFAQFETSKDGESTIVAFCLLVLSPTCLFSQGKVDRNRDWDVAPGGSSLRRRPEQYQHRHQRAHRVSPPVWDRKPVFLAVPRNQCTLYWMWSELWHRSLFILSVFRKCWSELHHQNQSSEFAVLSGLHFSVTFHFNAWLTVCHHHCVVHLQGSDQKHRQEEVVWRQQSANFLWIPQEDREEDCSCHGAHAGSRCLSHDRCAHLAGRCSIWHAEQLLYGPTHQKTEDRR